METLKQRLSDAYAQCFDEELNRRFGRFAAQVRRGRFIPVFRFQNNISSTTHFVKLPQSERMTEVETAMNEVAEEPHVVHDDDGSESEFPAHSQSASAAPSTNVSPGTVVHRHWQWSLLPPFASPPPPSHVRSKRKTAKAYNGARGRI